MPRPFANASPLQLANASPLRLNRGLPLKCDLCQGQPECVRMCPTGALRYVQEERAAVARRRTALGRLPELLDIMNFKKLAP